MTDRLRLLDELPLFAADMLIAEAISGRGCILQTLNLFALLERDGFPKRDPLIGLRYVPAVKHFFDRRAGIGQNRASSVTQADEYEEKDPWSKPRKRRRPALQA